VIGSKQHSFLDLVRLYRELGFFADKSGLSDDELTDHLNAQYRSVFHKDFEPAESLADLALLSLDKERLWWADLEDDVFPGRNAYVEILQEWAAISRGALQPADIVERWGRDNEPPVTISFRLGDRRHQLRTDIDEWIDLGLLEKINGFIRGSGLGFYTLATGDQSGAVIALTATEKARLQAARPAVFDHQASYAGAGPPEGYAYYVVEENAPSAVRAARGTWYPVRSQGAPSPRWRHISLWTGNELLIWGGQGSGVSQWLSDGGAYDPVQDSWRPLSLANSPVARQEPAWVSTGRELFLWGGWDQKVKALGDGARYIPDENVWRPVSPRRGPGRRWGAACVWTGQEVLVWGGWRTRSEYLGNGAAYDLAADTWRPLPLKGAPSPRAPLASAWTGDELLVWGGLVGPGSEVPDGALYDPLHGSWRPVATEGGPDPVDRSRPFPSIWHWTGTELMLWTVAQGSPNPVQGWAYDPALDRWRTLTATGAPEPAAWLHGGVRVWTGAELVVWRGPQAAAIYDYARDTWRPMAAEDAPRERIGSTAVWTGHQLVLWGGHVRAPEEERKQYGSIMLGDGAVYDLASDSWSELAHEGAPSPRSGGSAVWSGAEVIIWGGILIGQRSECFNDGARLRL
jgi:N-acetylneuraminic acid mutarotase